MEKEDSSSNDEAPAEGNATTPVKSTRQEVSGLLLDVVERLSKIAVLCESQATVDSSNVKTLIKHIHKFERDIRNLQTLSQRAHDADYNIFKGAVSAVDNYKNPYDWAYENIVKKYESTGERLDHALDSVDTLQKELITRLQVNKLKDSSDQSLPVRVTESDSRN